MTQCIDTHHPSHNGIFLCHSQNYIVVTKLKVGHSANFPDTVQNSSEVSCFVVCTIIQSKGMTPVHPPMLLTEEARAGNIPLLACNSLGFTQLHVLPDYATQQLRFHRHGTRAVLLVSKVRSFTMETIVSPWGVPDKSRIVIYMWQQCILCEPCPFN